MAYSFGRQRRFTMKEFDGGNSTSIDYEKWKTSSQFPAAHSTVIGRARRSARITTDGPGPGAYEKPSLIAREAPKAILLGKPRQSKLILQQPGPGAYDLKNLEVVLRKNPKFSFNHSDLKEQPDIGPGPAAYNSEITAISKTGPVVVFGKSRRESLEDSKNLPGPGQYQTTLNESSVQHGFPHQSKFKLDNDQLRIKTQIPGPGSYNLRRSDAVKGGVISRGRTRSSKQSLNPGPGAYNINFARHRSPEATIGNSPRSLTGRAEKGPGPCSYNVPPVEVYKQMNTSSILFGKDRKFQRAATETPGPGAYTTNCNQSQGSIRKGITIPGRHNTEKIEMGPGPQSYEPRPVLPRDPRPVFSREQRSRLPAENIPGPGKYNTDNDRKAKSFYFPRDRRRSQTQCTPGPGQYKLKPMIGQFPVYAQMLDSQDILYV